MPTRRKVGVPGKGHLPPDYVHGPPMFYHGMPVNLGQLSTGYAPARSAYSSTVNEASDLANLLHSEPGMFVMEGIHSVIMSLECL